MSPIPRFPAAEKRGVPALAFCSIRVLPPVRTRPLPTCPFASAGSAAQALGHALVSPGALRKDRPRPVPFRAGLLPPLPAWNPGLGRGGPATPAHATSWPRACQKPPSPVSNHPSKQSGNGPPPNRGCSHRPCPRTAPPFPHRSWGNSPIYRTSADHGTRSPIVPAREGPSAPPWIPCPSSPGKPLPLVHRTG